MTTRPASQMVRDCVLAFLVVVLLAVTPAMAASTPGQELARVAVETTTDSLEPSLVLVSVQWLQESPRARVRVHGVSVSALGRADHRAWAVQGGAAVLDVGRVASGDDLDFTVDVSGLPEGERALVVAERIAGRVTSQVLLDLRAGVDGPVVGRPAAYRLVDLPPVAGPGDRAIGAVSDLRAIADPAGGRVLIEALDRGVPTKAQVFGEDAANRSIPQPTTCGSSSPTWGVTRTISIGSAPSGSTIDHLAIHVEMTHPDMSDIEMGFFKDSQSGNFLWDEAPGTNLDTTFVDQDFYGQPLPALGTSVNGNYQLTVRDCATPDAGTLDYWSVTAEYSGGGGSVDLVADSLSLSPSSVTAGDSISVIYFGHVEGSASTGSSYSLGFFLSTDTTLSGSDVLLQQVTESSATDPGDSFGLGSPGRSITIPGGTAAGSYQLGFLVDSNDVVSESNEGNNLLWQPLTVSASGSQPNLRAVSCSVDPTAADAGDQVEFTWRGRNDGTTGAGPFIWGVYLSDDATIDPATDQLMAALDAPGGWSTGYDTGSYPVDVTVPGGLADGGYHVGIYLDTGDAVDESNEGDNWCAAPLTVGTSSATCTADDTTLCLNQGRFEVTADWRTADGRSGEAGAVTLTSDTGYFWFFDPDNVETVLKVINGCSVNSRYWVFSAGLTNVEVEIRVEDTEAGGVERYTNELDTEFLPILDTSAFATCP